MVPSTFQRTMDLALGDFHWSVCLVYLDDIIIYAKDEKRTGSA